MTRNSGKVIKSFSWPLMNSSKWKRGILRKHMYGLKSTEGEKTLKTEVKFRTHLKKFHLKNRQSVQTPIFHYSLKAFEKSLNWNLLSFLLPLLFQCDHNYQSKFTSRWPEKTKKKREQILKKDSAPIQFKFFEL